MLVLGIETSCDETAVGVVEDRFTVRSNVIASQVELHAPYGGVVPEVAARAHLELLQPTIERALVEAGCRLSDVDAIAVTSGPGLVGALLVGVAGAKGLALANDLPLLGVNHLRAHVEAAQLEYGELEPPVLALVVSGGHTSLVAMEAPSVDGQLPGFRQLGATIDDAAGEAFDKIARFLGLGSPAGPRSTGSRQRGNPKAFDFPRALLRDGTLRLLAVGAEDRGHPRAAQDGGRRARSPTSPTSPPRSRRRSSTSSCRRPSRPPPRRAWSRW